MQYHIPTVVRMLCGYTKFCYNRMIYDVACQYRPVCYAMVFVHHHCIICHITVGIIPYYIQYWPIDLHLAHAICNLHLVTLRFGKTMCEWNTDGLINTPHWQKPCNCHLYAWKYSDSIYERLSVYTPLTFALHMSWEMKATFWENSIICVNVYWYNYSNERHCILIVTRM